MDVVNLIARLVVTWILPGGLAVLVGVKKNRRGFGWVCALLFGALGFFLGLWLGWIGFIVVCCFPKAKGGSAVTEN